MGQDYMGITDSRDMAYVLSFSSIAPRIELYIYQGSLRIWNLPLPQCEFDCSGRSMRAVDLPDRMQNAPVYEEMHQQIQPNGNIENLPT